MALGLTTEGGGGDFAEIIKIDARAGRVFRVDRTQSNSGEWSTDNVEITNDFTAIWDMENIEVGWALFAAGIAPQFSLVKLGAPMPAKPSDQHKQAFRLNLKLGKSCGGDVRELASQAKAVISAVDKLHTEYTEGLKANAGKLPIVRMIGSVPITSTGKGQTSVNYAPVFEIVSWAPRPEGLGGTATTEVEPPPPPPKAKADVSQEF